MRIEHAALWVKDLEVSKLFFESYFGAVASSKYHNVKTGFQSYFLTFKDEEDHFESSESCRLEIMNRPDISEPSHEGQFGYAHLAFSLGSEMEVRALTERLRRAGYEVKSGPRVTGDGYYESVVLDGEGNEIELTV